MTYRDIDPQTLEALAVVFTSIGGAIMGIYHLIYRHLKGKINRDNHENLIDDRVSTLEQKLEKFQKWADEEHEEMNKETSEKIEGLTREVSKVKEAIAENTGYLKALLDKN